MTGGYSVQCCGTHKSRGVSRFIYLDVQINMESRQFNTVQLQLGIWDNIFMISSAMHNFYTVTIQSILTGNICSYRNCSAHDCRCWWALRKASAGTTHPYNELFMIRSSVFWWLGVRISSLASQSQPCGHGSAFQTITIWPGLSSKGGSSYPKTPESWTLDHCCSSKHWTL